MIRWGWSWGWHLFAVGVAAALVLQSWGLLVGVVVALVGVAMVGRP